MARDDKTTKFQQRPSRRPLRRLRVAIVAGASAGQSREGNRLTIGASDDNDLVLDDPEVSRYHLEIGRAGQQIEVKDLGSKNGTFIGTTRLVHAVVPPGSRLSLGNTAIDLLDGSSIAEKTVDRPDIPGLIGDSEGISEVAQLIHGVAPRAVSVLIEGETGTGKEVVASAIHEMSPRRDAPFVVVDCGAMPVTLIASELFGHERGAFTGADQRKIGAFEQANGGTLFLDEIGELPLPVQPSLLGALERRRFRRLGSAQPIDVDIRLLAATNRDLRAEANAESFRSDLYFRLAVARIKIPPLRERTDDIEPLVRHFVRECQGSENPFPFSPSTLDALRHQRWTGNVRELRNVVEAALAMGEIQLDRSVIQKPPTPGAPVPVRPYKEARKEAITHFETSYLANLIQTCEGNASAAARLAMMDRPYLLSLLKKHKLR